MLIFLAIWCFAIFCFGFGWIMGHAAAFASHADALLGGLAEGSDDLLERW
jgi:hypothetical protein